MRSTIAAALAAVGVGLPLAGAARGEVIFSDTFDGGSSASRYVTFSNDNDTETDPPYDTSSNFAYDYGTYNYKKQDAQGDVTIAAIPAAPNSNGTTVGLKLTANDDATVGTARISVYPLADQFVGGALPSGNHVLQFDMWINYNGFKLGGTGSTKYMVAGVNQVGTGVAAEGGNSGGLSFSVDGERGSTIDYRVYRDNTRLDNFAEAGYAAPDNAATFNDADPPAAITVTPRDGRNPYYRDLFPLARYETDGAPGKNWVTVQISYVDGVVSWLMNGDPFNPNSTFTLIASRTDLTHTSGNIVLGYADLTQGVATAVGEDFILFDNVTVTSLPIPEPTGAAALAAAGLLTLGRRGRRRER